jgi:hypothetical protein
MQPFPVNYEPTALTPQFLPRSRREVPIKDAINARNIEQWQTDGRYGMYDKPDLNAQRPFMDMNAYPTRTDDRLLRTTPRYKVDSSKQLDFNPYFDKYDIVNDPINAAREFSSAVYEDKGGRGIQQSAALLERQFTNRFTAKEETEKLVKMRLDAQQQLIPTLNDTTISYLDKRSGAGAGADARKY